MCNSRGFTYLRAAPGRDAADVVEENYRLDELKSRVVIRDEFHQRYRVFSAWADFWVWRDAVAPREQCFDEVVFGAFPQHLKFDIDAPGAKIDAVPSSLIDDICGAAPVPAYEMDDYLDGLMSDGEETPPAGPTDPAELLARDRQAKVDAILEHLIDVILDELQAAYFGLDDIAATRDDLIVFESSGQAGQDWKYSFHILVAPYAVANNEEAKGFTARVLAQLPPPLRELVDPQVNKSLQNFRLMGSSKPNSGRVKALTTRYGTASVPRDRTVVRAAPGARILTRLHTDEDADGQVRLLGSGDGSGVQAPDIAGEDLQAILAAARQANVLDGSHEFHQVRGDLILFRRLAPSRCRLCSRVHDHDNTLMLAVERCEETGPHGAVSADGAAREKAPHYLIECCRRAGRGASRAVARVEIARRGPVTLTPATGERGAKAPDAGPAVEARIAAIHSGEVDPHKANATGFEDLPAGRKTVYSEPQMRPYEAVPTLVVKAQMKLGKTRQLRNFLNREYPRREGALREPVIRFVTFRQTFSKSMQRESFPDFELYSDHPGDLDHIRYPRLIVQVESLHRLPMPEAPEPVDLLVLDEVESILAQFNSGLHKRFNAAFAMFQWMVATAGRVVAMDANVCDRTLHLLETMRGSHPPHFHWNQFQRASGDLYHFSADQAVWLDHLFERLRAGQRVVLPTNSLSEAETFEAAVRDRHPEKTVRLYSSKTPQREKEAHFADVHAHWSDLDVLIYTPTVSAGVSYELEHFDVLFGYFIDASCDVETCRQMLARVRNIGTREHFICLSGRTNNLPTAVEDIRRLVYDKRTNLYRRLDDAGAQLALQFEYGAGGEVLYHESAYFQLWLETTRVINLSRNQFVSRFVDQVADTGATVGALSPLPEAGGRLVEIKAGHRRLKLELAESEQEALAGAEDLDPEEAASVKDRLRRQADVAPDVRVAYLKYRLAETYKWHGRPMDAAFVRAYQNPQATRVYKNLLRITAGHTIVESLRLIQGQELGNNRALMEERLSGPAQNAAESRDLHQRYVFQSHFLAVWLLRLCGFRCLTDQELVCEETMYNRMRAREHEFLDQLEAISFEFQLRRPSVRSISSELDPSAYVQKVLGVVNPVQRMMYGIEVRRTRAAAGAKDFFINRTKIGLLFAFSADPLPDDAPGGAKPHIPSNLDPVGGVNGGVHHFLDTQYYAAARSRSDAG